MYSKILFEGGEIVSILTHHGNVYCTDRYQLGTMGSLMFAAIDRLNPKRVLLISLSAIEAIEVEYEQQQAASSNSSDQV
mgnify:CR=1 FL=1